MSKKITILAGHEQKDAISSQFAAAYAEAAQKAGHEVRLTYIADMKFDPQLHKGYREIQSLEPDLLKMQEDIRWCDHFVLAYPIWWINMPALLKGFFDRAWIPGFAYRFRKNGLGWNKLLAGKSARLLVTSQTQPWLLPLFFYRPTLPVKKALLAFAGFSPIRVFHIGKAEKVNTEIMAKHLNKVRLLGARGV